ncbi:MAG: tetratricopeptide repeat protein [Gaiella sp.]
MSAAYDHYQQGKRHLRDGMPAQATVALEKAKRLEPEKASIREALGIAYYRIARWDAAEAEFRKLVELAPADHDANFALGRALQKQGRDAEAAPFVALARCLRRTSPDDRSSDGLEAADQTSSRSASSEV